MAAVQNTIFWKLLLKKLEIHFAEKLIFLLLTFPSVIQPNFGIVYILVNFENTWRPHVYDMKLLVYYQLLSLHIIELFLDFFLPSSFVMGNGLFGVTFYVQLIII